MGVTQVEVEIEELVLHGFSRSDAVAVAASIERSLRVQFADSSSRFGKSRTIERVDAKAIEVTAGATPRAIGGAVAERLHRSVRA
jgi:hypothetical protein